jgi:hypothetical protein
MSPQIIVNILQVAVHAAISQDITVWAAMPHYVGCVVLWSSVLLPSDPLLNSWSRQYPFNTLINLEKTVILVVSKQGNTSSIRTPALIIYSRNELSNVDSVLELRNQSFFFRKFGVIILQTNP